MCIRWINDFLVSSSVSILINGNPTCEFKLERGLCQEDLLSPFLFLSVMEALNVVMFDVMEATLFSPIDIGEKCSVVSLIICG